MLLPVKTRLADIQTRLKKMLPHDAVLVGHSLNSDLQALEVSMCLYEYFSQPCGFRPENYEEIVGFFLISAQIFIALCYEWVYACKDLKDSPNRYQTCKGLF